MSSTKVIAAAALAGILLLAASGARFHKALQSADAHVQALDERLKNVETFVTRTELRDNFAVEHPSFTNREISALSYAELETKPAELKPTKQPFAEQPNFKKASYETAALAPTYVYFTNNVKKQLEVDRELPLPRIEIQQPTSVKPRIVIDGLEGLRPFQSNQISFYVEADSDPSFTSPNFWRYPALLETALIEMTPLKEDLAFRNSLEFDVFSTTQRNADGKQTTVEFPFRVSAMRLPWWDKLDFSEMQRQAQALAFGLDPDDSIREVFSFGRQIYPWASDTITRNAVATFVAGLGECAHVNNLIGTFLEMNGLRYRMVAGFNPLVRQAFPTGGHSAIEVLSPKSGWSYVDPYLDVLAIGGSAQDIAQTGMFQNLRVYPLTDKFREFGSVLTLPDLLKYRTYGDQLGRLPSATMSMLFGRENEYGLQWELNEVPRARPAELFSVSRRIYVRARYIVSEKASVHHTADADRTLSAGRTVASGWVTTSFVTHPLQLVTSASAAFNQNGFR